MTDVLERVRDHYRADGLTDRLRAALLAYGPDDGILAPQQLASLDQFHTRGLAATAEIAELAGIAADMDVLDIGAGIGGPARFLAATLGCRVTGVDLSEPFVDAARYLTNRTGQSAAVSFETGNALDLPFGDAGFDVALLQHVAMNVADRPRLYREARRIVRRGGRLAVYDVVSGGGEPLFPLPWASTPEASFLLSADETRGAIEEAGFRTLAWQDETEVAKAWILQMRAAPPLSPNMGVVMGPGFTELVTNLGRSLMEGRVGVLTALFEAV
jgi:ubiquinone/menaquinone biosynthesis C-methylase UbiE